MFSTISSFSVLVSVDSASCSDAATLVTSADLNAAACTSETSIRRAALTRYTPPLLIPLITSTPTDKPLRRFSDASIKLSVPRVVLDTLNSAKIPELSSVTFFMRPIGCFGSCSNNSFTFVGSSILIEPASKITLPAEVLPISSPNGTILPAIIRRDSDASRSAEKLIISIRTQFFHCLGLFDCY